MRSAKGDDGLAGRKIPPSRSVRGQQNRSRLRSLVAGDEEDRYRHLTSQSLHRVRRAADWWAAIPAAAPLAGSLSQLSRSIELLRTETSAALKFEYGRQVVGIGEQLLPIVPSVLRVARAQALGHAVCCICGKTHSVMKQDVANAYIAHLECADRQSEISYLSLEDTDTGGSEFRVDDFLGVSSVHEDAITLRMKNLPAVPQRAMGSVDAATYTVELPILAVVLNDLSPVVIRGWLT